MSLRVVQIGCGYWGRNLARNFHELGVLAGIVDGNPETAREQAGLYGVETCGLEACLADPQIGAIALATPAATHAALAQKALEAGKHVLVEKPLALTLKDAEAVIATAERCGKVLMVGHLLHYHPLFEALRGIVEQGQFGKLKRISSTRLSLGKLRTEEDVLWSFAPHDIAMVLALAGREPLNVLATGQSLVSQAFSDPALADRASLELDLGDGLLADITVSWWHPFKEQRLIVIGEKAMAVFEDSQPDWSRKLAVYEHGLDENGPAPVKTEPAYVEIPQDQPLRLECQHFIDCIKKGRTPLSDGHEGRRVLSVLARAQENMAQKAGPADPFIHESAIVDPGVGIGAGTRIWHFSHLLKGTVIGERCTIGQNVMIGPDVSVGNGCKIQNNVSLYKGVSLADEVFCGPSCVFTNVNTPRAGIERKDSFLKTRVGTGASIGANATIVCGHDIGAYAFIGAGAVVIDDVPPFALMVGNPARRIGWVGHGGERLIEDGEHWRCPSTNRRYRLAADGPIEIT